MRGLSRIALALALAGITPVLAQEDVAPIPATRSSQQQAAPATQPSVADPAATDVFSAANLAAADLAAAGVDVPASPPAAAPADGDQSGPPLLTDDPNATVGDDPDSPSDDVPAGSGPRDAAFGAYQRGYYFTALALALPRASKGDASAQTLIGEIYAQGLGVPEDHVKASSWFALASKNGDPLATLELALNYESGDGVPQDRAKAATLFKQAADAGNIPAKYNLALLYVDGTYVEPDLAKAATLMKEAADAGLPEAQYDYGGMLMDGAGVAPNPQEGAREIGLAAAQGLADAQVDYATLLYLGQGVPRDVAGAARWYRAAAGLGNPVAQNRYAKLLAVGEGVDLDLQEAAMWRSLARRQGLNDPALDKLLVSIPADDLARAEERARFWPSDPPADSAQASADFGTAPTSASPATADATQAAPQP